MIGSLRSLNGQERVVRDLGDALRLREACLAPDFQRVATISEALQPLRETLLLGLERRQREWRGMRDQRNRRLAKILDPSLHIAVRASGQVARSGAADAPDQGSILGVELLHALVRLDHLRPADAHPGVLGNDDTAATGGDDAAATEGSGATADQRQNWYTGAAHLEDGADVLGK